MAQPVWSLSVDLTTKTATFQSGLADAAKSARGAFADIKSGSSEMSDHVSGNMFASRHAVMAVSEAFGDTMPRAITALLVHIGPLGAALEAAFPFAAIGLGAVLLIEHFEKLKEAGHELTEDQVRFGTTVQNVFNSLDQKMLQAGIRADELRGDHIGALGKELKAIDMQSLDDLAASFQKIAKEADVTFAKLQSHWYTLGVGSDGAKNALEDFQVQYEALLAKGKDKDASDLLKGTRESAEKILTLQKQITSPGPITEGNSDSAYQKIEEAKNALKRAGKGYSEDEVKSQQALLGVLVSQEEVERNVADLKKQQSSNASVATHQTINKESEQRAKEQLEGQKRAAEEAKKFYEDAYKGYVQVIDEGEKEKIDATKEGSAARLAAIDSAIKEEQTEQLTSTSYYRELLQQRVTLVRQMAEEETKEKADAAREMADNDEKMALLGVAAEREQMALRDSMRRMTDQQRIAEELRVANEEFEIKATSMAKEISALDKEGKDYENKLREMQDKERQMVQQHENEVTAIKDKAEMDRNARILSAGEKFQQAMAQSLTQSIMGHQSWAKMVDSLGSQVVSSLIQHALMTNTANEMTKRSDAAKIARSAYKIGEEIPIIGPVAGPAFAAAAFAGAMAFAAGGIVPGIGNGDTVPAMLTPGEAVLPKNMTEGLMRATQSGGAETHHHFHIRPTYHLQALDTEGMSRVLKKHSGQLQEHFEGTLRRMNR